MCRLVKLRGCDLVRVARESQRFVLITNLASRLANHIQNEKAPAHFVQLPGVKSLMEPLKLSDAQALEWEGVVRKKVKQQFAPTGNSN